MEKFLELISNITVKHEDILKKLIDKLERIEKDVINMDKEFDQRSALFIENDTLENNKLDIVHLKKQLQEERESILRVKNNVSQFFVDDWQELKSTFVEVNAQILQEDRILNKKLEKTRNSIQALTNEETRIQAQIARNHEICLFDYVLAVLPYMPIEIDVTKLSKQPKYIQEEILQCIFHERELPERLRKIV